LPKEASKAVKEKIRKAATGRIALANPTPERVEALNSLSERIRVAKSTGKWPKPDWTLTGVKVDSVWGKWQKKIHGETLGNDGGFEVSWSTVSCGFGGLTFYLKDGKLHCDNEGMSKKFIMKVFKKLVEETQLDNEPQKKGK
jgi:hypothetical protein